MAMDKQNESKLAESIRASRNSAQVVNTTLQTSERVIARVTDGIYRQPGSALRELISNAYDADARRVIIKTDAPRFERILVEDDGIGMSPEMLAHLLMNIGGSAKRNQDGVNLGIASKSNPEFSPNGRRLIGKIGIGLFSVSQLTHTFQIITKLKGDNFRTIASVILRQYSDDEIGSSDDDKQFESGKVSIWREKAADAETQGTSIVLTGIRPQARDILRSREIWDVVDQVESGELDDSETGRPPIDPPTFHIGRLTKASDRLRETDGATSSLPWEKTDQPDIAFRKLVDSVWDQLDSGTPKPQLSNIFDFYLRMVWQLSLSVPVPYIAGHLFDEDVRGWATAFELSNEPKGGAERIPAAGSTLRAKCGLKDTDRLSPAFDVYIDELRLFRPLRFRGLPTSSNAIKHSLVFVGKCNEVFPKLLPELSGGPLQFEAYLFWNPKIAPTEHQGALVRIHGSSGTLFDPTFMRYQVAEVNRLRQISCEIFVQQGLDSALNIDRESFNQAHPHAIYIARWLHSALRQVATTQKKLAGEVREQVRDQSTSVAVSNIHSIVRAAWKTEVDEPGSRAPSVKLIEKPSDRASSGDSYVYPRGIIGEGGASRSTSKARARSEVLEEKLKAIVQVLAAYGVLDRMSQSRQERMLRVIFEILSAPED